MSTAAVGLIGASGYSGLELTRLLAGHPGVRLDFVTSDRWQGQAVGLRAGGAAARLRYIGNDEALSRAGGCAVVFLATPAETSLELAPRLLAAGTRVVDLAGSFRLKDAALYPPFYRFTHGHPELLAEAAYGLPELFRRDVPGARLVANPGCYATTVALAVAPLLKEGLIGSRVVVTAASGVSGAGRKVAEEYGFMEVEGDFRAYRVLTHQHTPEIHQTVTSHAGRPLQLTFIPHLLPTKRGILATVVAPLTPGTTAAHLAEALRAAYGEEPLVDVAPGAEAVRVADVVHTPRVRLGVSCDAETVVVTAALDNLLKGAASQAVQNLNLLLGLDETEGL